MSWENGNSCNCQPESELLWHIRPASPSFCMILIARLLFFNIVCYGWTPKLFRLVCLREKLDCIRFRILPVLNTIYRPMFSSILVHDLAKNGLICDPPLGVCVRSLLSALTHKNTQKGVAFAEVCLEHQKCFNLALPCSIVRRFYSIRPSTLTYVYNTSTEIFSVYFRCWNSGSKELA